MAVEGLRTFGLARSIEEQAQSIESQAECYFPIDFQLSPSSFLPQVYKANPSHVLEIAHIAVCEISYEICEEFSFTQA